MGMFLVCFGILVLGASSTKAQTCFNETVKKLNTTDIFRGVIYFQEVPNTVTSVSSWSITSDAGGIDKLTLQSYFNFNVSDDTFWMYTTDSFDSFSKNAYAPGVNVLVNVQFELLFNCGSTLDIFLLIADSLSYAPTFSQSEYEFVVPMPITKYSDFTLNNGEDVIVEEINFSNTEMTFSIEPDHFEVLSTQITNKTFKASFQAKELFQFTENQTYTLTATNSASNQTSVKLTITIDSEEGLDTPLFDQPYYLYEFSDNTLSSKSDPIQVTSSKSNNCIYKLNGEYATSFQIEFDNETAAFTLSLSTISDTLLSGVSGQLYLSLLYTTDATTTTAIIVDIVDVIPSFSEDYYEGVYNASTKEISWSNPVVVYKAVEVKLEDGISELFTINENDYTIKATDSLSENRFDANNNIIFGVTAISSTKNEAKAIALVSLKTDQVSEGLQFDHTLYNAKYELTSDSATVTLDADSKIGFKNLNDFTGLVISVDSDFQEYFVVALTNDEWVISVKNKLTNTILYSNTELIISLTANNISAGTTAEAVLVISLPDLPSVEFEKAYYKGTYKQNDDGDEIVLDENIVIKGGEGLDDFSITVEDYDEDFNVVCLNNACTIAVKNKLDPTILSVYSQLLLTIKATLSGTLTDHTVLVLDLTSNATNINIEFEQIYYSARYVLDSSGEGQVNLQSDLIALKNERSLNVTFNFDGYEDVFSLSCQTGTTSCTVNVLSGLDSSILSKEAQLIITINAVTLEGNLTSKTALILDLPGNPHYLSFGKSYYTGTYKPQSLKLDEIVTLSSQDYKNITFTFDTYQDNFEIESLTEVGTYSVKVNEPLNELVLSNYTEIIVDLTVKDINTGDTASTALALKLPLYLNDVFESDHYEFEYLKSNDSNSAGLQILGEKIKIKSSEYTNLVVLGYEEYVSGSCDIETLYCTLELQNELNETTLSLTEVLVSLVASTSDGFSTGKSVLLLNLPPKNSTFAFTKSFFRANYSIQSSDTELASLTLLDSISLEGAYSTGVEIVLEDYSDYIRLTLSSSEWSAEIVKNLEESILSENRQLVTSLIAKNAEGISSTKATFIIQLPDESTIHFSKPIYYSDYDISNQEKPQVILAEDSQIEISDMQNTQITLKSMSEYFEVVINDSTWVVTTHKLLNNTMLSQYSELNVEMSIQKAGVSYGKSLLIIRLPSIKFSNELYEATYLIDDDGKANFTTEQIKIDNIDEDYVEVTLTNWSTYFSLSVAEGICTLGVTQNLTPDITDNYGTLVTNLVATRLSDGRTLATSTLIISLADVNSTDFPSFAQFTFYGQYKNSDSPTVSLEQSITLAYGNQAVATVSIDSSSGSFASNFELYEEDYNNYTVKVIERLSQEIIENTSNIVLTLVATSTQSKSSYATLVIELPKAVRNTSVQVENQEILFTATYENGVLTSPRIYLKFADNDGVQRSLRENEDVAVKITNDLGIDDDYFHYTYINYSLTIEMDPLPDDLLSNLTVIPLKLAITDRSTQDTVHAVLNVKVGSGTGTEAANDSSHQGVINGLIAAVSILAVLLALLLLAAFAYWFLKLRKSESVDEETTPTTTTPTFTKNEAKKPYGSFPSGQLRRPTGLAVGIPSPIFEFSPSEELDSETPEDSPELDRKVAFNDNVEEIDTANDDGNEGLQSVADRRPTKFVFSNGNIHLPDDRRESSDYNIREIPEERRRSLGLQEPEGKKAVAFDDNVERMHIDAVEATEEEESDEESDEDTDTSQNYKVEAEMQVTDQEKLSSL